MNMKNLLFLFLLLNAALYISSLSAADNSKDTKYTVTKEGDIFSCLKPNAIKGIETVYLKNDNGDVIYTIEIWGSEGTCDWQKDKMLFKKNLPQSEIVTLSNQFEQKLYLKSTMNLIFKVKKRVNSGNLASTTIEIPYFIILNNKKDNNIIFKKDLKIKINLPKKGEIIIKGEKINIEESFRALDFIYLEGLSGIYFKNTVANIKR